MKMTGRLDPPLRMLVSRSGKILSADDVLMRYQIDAGGTKDGELALPGLMAVIRNSQNLGMPLSRALTIANHAHRVDLWCDVRPADDGTELTVRDWREVPHNDFNAKVVAETINDEQYSFADGSLRLDAQQRILAIRAPVMLTNPINEAQYLLRPWYDYFELDHRPDTISNWEIFRRHILKFPEDAASWAMVAEPRLGNDRSVIGYDVQLNLVTDIRATDDTVDMVLGSERLQQIFGGQIGPALRQPIGRIIANAETIGGRLEGPIRSDYANYASDIANAGRHLLALVEDLTDLEAIESQGFQAASEDIDLSDLARRAAGLLALRAADNQIKIDTPTDDEILMVKGEFRRVLQILLNLVGNAINYSPIGSVIWLRLDEGDDWASITIADQGSGIEANEQAKLFQKWERLGRSGDGGSGLGLYISKQLAIAMNGDITVDSAPGQGARFTLRLPRA